MYRIEGRELADGRREAEAVEFHTAAGLLRWALNTRVLAHHVGGVPYPARFDDVHLGYREGDAGYDYHLIDVLTKYRVTSAHLTAMRRVQRRYMEIIHHLREVDPQWEPDRSVSANGCVHCADHSVRYHEISRTYGIRRSRMIQWPSGDACF